MPSELNVEYADLILADKPIGYWRLNERSPSDHVANESGKCHFGAFSTTKPVLGEPGAIEGDPNKSMTFAPNAFIEILHSSEFSIQSSGNGLTVEAWVRPTELLFQGEGDKRYIHWLGKGVPEKMEWGFRLYSSDHPERPSRISAYAWNPQGGLGAGAYYQGDLVKQGEWLHFVACYEHYVCCCESKPGVQLFVNGEFVQGPPSSGTLYFNEGEWSVLPRGGDAPLRLGTRSATTNSFLTGSLDEVAIYPYVLTPKQIKQHHDVAKSGAIWQTKPRR